MAAVCRAGKGFAGRQGTARQHGAVTVKPSGREAARASDPGGEELLESCGLHDDNLAA